MKRQVLGEDKPRSRARRIVTAVFGAFFVALAIAIGVSGDGPTSLGVVVAALGVGLLGVDACVAAVRDRPSLMERIGPLP